MLDNEKKNGCYLGSGSDLGKKTGVFLKQLIFHKPLVDDGLNLK